MEIQRLYSGMGILVVLVPCFLLSCKKDPATTSQTVELINDGFTMTSGTKAFQGGLLANEAVASRFELSGTVTVKKIHLLYGGGTSQTSDVVIKIYKDDAKTTNPGGMVYEGTHSLKTHDDTLRTIDLSAANVKFANGGAFRVAVFMKHDGLPCLAADADGTIYENKNFLFSGGVWYQSSTLGLSGDWILRVEVVQEK